MTKAFYCLLALIFLINPSFGQNRDIKKTYELYIKATKSEDIEKQIDFLHPEQFDYFPKDTLIRAFEMIRLDSTITIGDEKLISISNIYDKNGIKYALVSYSQNMTMDLSQMKGQSGANFGIQLILTEFNQLYGEENINFDEEYFQVQITMNNEMYAILNPAYDGWKFLSNDSDMSSINSSIIPEEIQEKIQKNTVPNKK